MRLACTLTQEDHLDPIAFSAFLDAHAIRHSFEERDRHYDFWVYDEEQLHMTQALLEDFKKKAPLFDKGSLLMPQIKYIKKPKRLCSFWIFFLTIALFVGNYLETRNSQIDPHQSVFPRTKIEKWLLYDDPLYLKLQDELIIAQHQNPTTTPSLIQRMKQTPLWTGLYNLFLAKLNHQQTTLHAIPSFAESIRKGEAWRFFTPALLHADLLHILFNLIWFWILAKQIESKVGSFKLLCMILTIALFSNTGQYIVSGPLFMGVSGVVCGLATFIYIRQKQAPWEGYTLHRTTWIFLATFVLGLCLVQSFVFIAQIVGFSYPSIRIANTAHIIGGLTGAVFGKWRVMAYHTIEA